MRKEELDSARELERADSGSHPLLTCSVQEKSGRRRDEAARHIAATCVALDS